MAQPSNPNQPTPTAKQRAKALKELTAERGLAASEALFQAIADRSARVRRAAKACFVSLGLAAHDVLVAALGHPLRAPWAAAVLARTVAGRQRLAAQPEAGLAHIKLAIDLASPSNVEKRGLAKALAVVPSTAAHGLLRRLAATRNATTRAEVLRVLAACSDRYALDVILAVPQPEHLLLAEIEWLGNQTHFEALPLLRWLAGPRGWLRVDRTARAAARQALRKTLEALSHISDAALAVAPPPGPSALALALWRDPNGDDQDDDDGLLPDAE